MATTIYTVEQSLIDEHGSVTTAFAASGMVRALADIAATEPGGVAGWLASPVRHGDGTPVHVPAGPRPGVDDDLVAV